MADIIARTYLESEQEMWAVGDDALVLHKVKVKVDGEEVHFNGLVSELEVFQGRLVSVVPSAAADDTACVTVMRWKMTFVGEANEELCYVDSSRFNTPQLLSEVERFFATCKGVDVGLTRAEFYEEANKFMRRMEVPVDTNRGPFQTLYTRISQALDNRGGVYAHNVVAAVEVESEGPRLYVHRKNQRPRIFFVANGVGSYKFIVAVPTTSRCITKCIVCEKESGAHNGSTRRCKHLQKIWDEWDFQLGDGDDGVGRVGGGGGGQDAGEIDVDGALGHFPQEHQPIRHLSLPPREACRDEDNPFLIRRGKPILSFENGILEPEPREGPWCACEIPVCVESDKPCFIIGRDVAVAAFVRSRQCLTCNTCMAYTGVSDALIRFREVPNKNVVWFIDHSLVVDIFAGLVEGRVAMEAVYQGLARRYAYGPAPRALEEIWPGRNGCFPKVFLLETRNSLLQWYLKNVHAIVDEVERGKYVSADHLVCKTCTRQDAERSCCRFGMDGTSIGIASRHVKSDLWRKHHFNRPTLALHPPSYQGVYCVHTAPSPADRFFVHGELGEQILGALNGKTKKSADSHDFSPFTQVQMNACKTSLLQAWEAPAHSVTDEAKTAMYFALLPYDEPNIKEQTKEDESLYSVLRTLVCKATVPTSSEGLAFVVALLVLSNGGDGDVMIPGDFRDVPSYAQVHLWDAVAGVPQRPEHLDELLTHKRNIDVDPDAVWKQCHACAKWRCVSSKTAKLFGNDDFRCAHAISPRRGVLHPAPVGCSVAAYSNNRNARANVLYRGRITSTVWTGDEWAYTVTWDLDPVEELVAQVNVRHVYEPADGGVGLCNAPEVDVPADGSNVRHPVGCTLWFTEHDIPVLAGHRLHAAAGSPTELEFTTRLSKLLTFAIRFHMQDCDSWAPPAVRSPSKTVLQIIKISWPALYRLLLRAPQHRMPAPLRPAMAALARKVYALFCFSDDLYHAPISGHTSSTLKDLLISHNNFIKRNRQDWADVLRQLIIDVAETYLTVRMTVEEMRACGRVSGPQFAHRPYRLRLCEMDVVGKGQGFYASLNLPKPLRVGGQRMAAVPDPVHALTGKRLKSFDVYVGTTGVCNKDAPRSKTYTPGLFTTVCNCREKNGGSKLLSIKLMDAPESPRAAMDTLESLAKLPTCVFYDNVCHLREYCISRNPSKYFGVIFVADAFHGHKHSACPDTYLKREWAEVEIIRGANSSAMEQHNQELISHIVPFFSAHNATNGLNIVEMYAAMTNAKKPVHGPLSV